MPDPRREFIYRVLIVFALIVLGGVLLRISTVLPLIFGAVLVAVLFRAIAEPLARRTNMPDGLALAAAVTIIFGILAAAAWLLGSEVRAQVAVLTETVPASWQALERRLEAWGMTDQLDEMVADMKPSGSGMLSQVGGVALTFGSGLADLLLVLVGGVYLAAQPQLYRTGLLKLVPPSRRELAADAVDDSGRALRLWLLGQLVSMTIIGTVTGIGLWLIGVPSALTLGLLAGLLEFIAIIGPIIAAIPALLIALTQGADVALWTLGLYIMVQQLEGNIVQPMVQQRAVDLPPALLLFSLVISGLLFGIVGVILAAPMTVLVFVLVKRLYVREALQTETSVPGEKTEEPERRPSIDGSDGTARAQ
ncbi:MAG TPA: AI-2E family transporter [Sphingomicrobium sp.]|nr:AI-2E family transporter [Sphingomicrobium sp.]